MMRIMKRKVKLKLLSKIIFNLIRWNFDTGDNDNEENLLEKDSSENLDKKYQKIKNIFGGEDN